jgi:phosphoserine phosphatase
MTKYAIFDLDNTISNDAWRIDRIEWQHTDPTRRRS